MLFVEKSENSKNINLLFSGCGELHTHNPGTQEMGTELQHVWIPVREKTLGINAMHESELSGLSTGTYRHHLATITSGPQS